ncbi:MAG: peroxidase, partial [Candidatus Eiseniibacteriota bacterium]
MIDLDDIQHFLVTRTPALAARYEFLTFPDPDKGRAWLGPMLEKVGSAKAVGTGELDSRWVTVALTWNGLRALGVDEK